MFSSFCSLHVAIEVTLQPLFTFRDIADSSDDSYVSAEEDPMEAPVFDFHLQDTVAKCGSDVLLKCNISGTPIPEGIK